MIFNMMRRLHMGCGESLKGSYMIPAKQQSAESRVIQAAQKRPFPSFKQGKKRP